VLHDIREMLDPSRIQWRFGPVSCRERPRLVLTDLPVCGNCHSFSADGTWLGMDVDYANDRGSYALTRIEEQTVLDAGKILTWSDYKRDENEPTFGLLSQVSPDGNYVVSTVKDRSVFVPKPEIEFSQLFFPIKGILAVYSRRTKNFSALPGADDPEYVQSNAVWSADGKRIIFARSKAYALSALRDQGKVLLTEEECREFLKEGKTFRFDLYSVPFNEGRGGKAEPLEGASNNGMSNYFPKCSPDGKWIVFCKAKSFMLLQPDSELYILPATGGEARRLQCNTGRMNSWHSWSPNSKWLVFSSKARGPYTQLFLTHIDEEGNSTPPVVLDRFTSSDRAANIPEFVNLSPGAIQNIRDKFTDDHSYWRAGNEFLKAQDWKNAERMFRKALAMNPRNINARVNLGSVLTRTERVEEGIKHLRAALEVDPRSAAAHHCLAVALAMRGRVDEAVVRCRKALEVKPDMADARNTLGAMLLRQGETAQAMAEFRHAVEADPRNANALANLAHVEVGTGQLDLAAEHYRRSLRLRPAGDIYQALAGLLARQGKKQEALELCEQAASSLSSTAENRYCRGRMWQAVGRRAEAAAQFRAALELDAGHLGAGHQLGLVLAEMGHTADAIRQYRRVLERHPDHRQTLGNLARLLTTAADPARRDGTEAVRLAEKAARLADARNFVVLDTLAAAYAEANRWEEALITQRQAIRLAESQRQVRAVPPMRQRLDLYELHQPWRE